MRIYTKGGDKGKTGIHGGKRVNKDDSRIEAIGSLDELNSCIGVVRAYLEPDDKWQELLFTIQSEIMVIMSLVATPADNQDKNPNKLNPDIVSYIENHIDFINDQIPDSGGYFILPGGNLISSHLHMARTIARRAERRLWTLNKEDEVNTIILTFTNRLSDLFFIMARAEMSKDGLVEEKWKHFLYKRKK